MFAEYPFTADGSFLEDFDAFSWRYRRKRDDILCSSALNKNALPSTWQWSHWRRCSFFLSASLLPPVTSGLRPSSRWSPTVDSCWWLWPVGARFLGTPASHFGYALSSEADQTMPWRASALTLPRRRMAVAGSSALLRSSRRCYLKWTVLKAVNGIVVCSRVVNF